MYFTLKEGNFLFLKQFCTFFEIEASGFISFFFIESSSEQFAKKELHRNNMDWSRNGDASFSRRFPQGADLRPPPFCRRRNGRYKSYEQGEQNSPLPVHRDRRAIYPNHIGNMTSSAIAPMWASAISEMRRNRMRSAHFNEAKSKVPVWGIKS